MLADWARLFDEPGTPAAEARLLRPVTTADLEALSVLADQPTRLADHDYHWTQGWNETNAKTDGTIRWETAIRRDSWDEVILQGPHFSVATPFNKQPNENCKNNRDYSDWDLESLPATSHPPHQLPARLRPHGDLPPPASTHWNGHPATAHWRIIWRTHDSTRPGAVDPRCVASSQAHATSSCFGRSQSVSQTQDDASSASLAFWRRRPIDYLTKVSGRADITFDLHVPCDQGPATGTNRDPMTPALVHPNPAAQLFDRRSTPHCGKSCTTRPGRTTPGPIRPSPAHSLQAVGSTWTMDTPLRRDQDRWQALVELDALAALMLGLTAEQLCAMYRTQFAVLRKYEYKMVFDAEGRKICGYHQSGRLPPGPTPGSKPRRATVPKEWKNLWNLYEQYEAEPTTVDWGDHYTAPFTRVDREAAMTRAYETFAARHPEPT